MAKATKVVVDPEFVLSLTAREASVLRTFIGSLPGKLTPYGGELTAIWGALVDVGAEYDDAAAELVVTHTRAKVV